MTEAMQEMVQLAGLDETPAWAKTKFGAWVVAFGVVKLAAELLKRGQGVTDSSVYYWLRGETAPRPDKALELVSIAGGALTLDDIYAHANEVKLEKKA